jgi:hypothetical protein
MKNIMYVACAAILGFLLVVVGQAESKETDIDLI